jgi:DNA invertase Pin-like site-specific DNA recombinase
MTKTIAYLRVSTDKQADHGSSLDAQKAKVEMYAGLYELELTEIITDAGESASTLDRPGLQRALGLIRAGKADAMLVCKLDRLTRSVKDLGALIEGPFAQGKAALLSVSEQFDTRSAAGRLVLNVLASVSQWEREAIGERTAAVMQHKKRLGEFTGGCAPYGFRLAADGVHIEGLPEERAVIEAARALRTARVSLRKIAAELDRRGHRSRTGRVFLPEQIRMMTAA